jgi:hypothetical protein
VIYQLPLTGRTVLGRAIPGSREMCLSNLCRHSPRQPIRPSSSNILSPGDEELVRCRVVEHFGDDLMVVIESPRGSTKVQIGAGEIVRVGAKARHQ